MIEIHGKDLHCRFHPKKLPVLGAGYCAFPLVTGERLVLSVKDCLEVFLTVADGMPPSFGRDEIYYRMADFYKTEECACQKNISQNI